MRILKSLALTITAISALFALSGCIPVMVGAIAYSSAKTGEQRREFIRDYHTNNTLREQAGLEPLDLCTEKYKFDKYWARQDPECKEKVKEFDKDEQTHTSKEAEQLQGVIENR